MALQENLRKTKNIMAITNFITAAMVIGAYIVSPQDIEYRHWFLIAGLLFAGSGIGIIIFINRLQKKFDKLPE